MSALCRLLRPCLVARRSKTFALRDQVRREGTAYRPLASTFTTFHANCLPAELASPSRVAPTTRRPFGRLARKGLRRGEDPGREKFGQKVGGGGRRRARLDAGRQLCLRRARRR
jgi:hypothetical protein